MTPRESARGMIDALEGDYEHRKVYFLRLYDFARKEERGDVRGMSER